MTKSNKVFKYVNGNTSYNIKTARLHIYTGIITSPVVSHRIEGDYQISKTKSGSTYITVIPTYFTTNVKK